MKVIENSIRKEDSDKEYLIYLSQFELDVLCFVARNIGGTSKARKVFSRDVHVHNEEGLLEICLREGFVVNAEDKYNINADCDKSGIYLNKFDLIKKCECCGQRLPEVK